MAEDARLGGWVTRGDSVTVCDTPLGRIGMIICFDGDYPELSRIQAVQGAEVICRPSALLRSADIWELTSRARAYDNHVYVIGANAVGYAFKLALQSISPDIDKLLTELQDQINKINAMNINSCEAAQALVNGLVGEYDSSVQSGCANISQYLGSVSDRAEARMTCATNAPAEAAPCGTCRSPRWRTVR